MNLTSGRGLLRDIDITLGLNALGLPLALSFWCPWALCLCLTPRRSYRGLGHDVMPRFLASAVHDDKGTRRACSLGIGCRASLAAEQKEGRPGFRLLQMR